MMVQLGAPKWARLQQDIGQCIRIIARDCSVPLQLRGESLGAGQQGNTCPCFHSCRRNMKQLVDLVRTCLVYGFVMVFSLLTRFLKRCLDLSHSLAV
ncbi:hypothetical protein M5D96_012197 [Drosophila gunungcola]|uniref:Uncharacterized protein n=1 Tax=Drosophila gunungcola TaxID=103775 RepID=A0A9P9YDD9_9MUSC|nr:hypothetical protein M5D96_012197 [Drosophila gunungcola]